MNRCLGWAMLLLAGMAIGYTFGSHDPVAMAQPGGGDDPAAEIVAELKEIKSEAKEINLLLHSGKMRVIVPIYPDSGVK
jgi:hypothetical protein